MIIKIEEDKIQKIATLMIGFSILLLNINSGLDFIVRTIIIPLCLLISLKSKYFDALLIGMVFMDDYIGTLFLGHISYYWVYPVFCIVKIVLYNNKIKMDTHKVSNFIAMAAIILFFDIFIYIPNDFDLGMRQLLYLIASASIYVRMENNEDNFEWVQVILSVFSATSAIGSVINPSAIDEAYGIQQLSGSGFSDPNYASLFYVMGIAAALLLKNEKLRLFKIATITANIIGLIKGVSRTGLLGLCIVIIVYILLQLPTEHKFKKMLRTIIFVICIIYVALYFVPTDFFDAWKVRLELTFDALNGRDYSSMTSGRMEIAISYLHEIFSGPIVNMLFGLQITPNQHLVSVIGYVTHNTYIDMLIQFGIVGTTMLLVFWLKRFISRINSRKRLLMDNLPENESQIQSEEFRIMIAVILAFYQVTLSCVALRFWPVLFLL